jgi:hypothetical protein
VQQQSENDRSLEDGIVSRLRNEGLIKRGSSRRAGFGVAGALALGAGIMVAIRPGHAPAAQTTYMVALYGGPDYRELSANDRSRAVEYGAWARAHRPGSSASAAVTGGEELGQPVAAFGRSRPELLGYFTIRARNDQEAVALAKSTPHLRYGGSIVVQPFRT